MTDKKQSDRRKVLKTTLAGGAVVTTSILPDTWKKPSMDSIVLPSHAETTNDVLCNANGFPVLIPASECPPGFEV